MVLCRFIVNLWFCYGYLRVFFKNDILKVKDNKM